MPSVSVIIPAHNAEAFIEHAVDSVFAQTFSDYELIVVNDGSTDHTLDKLGKYGNRLTCLTQECKGPGASRNLAIRRVNSPLVTFLDADDLWLPTKLEKQVRFAQEHPEYGIITTDVSWFNDSGTTNSSLKTKYPVVNGMVAENILFDNWVSTSAAMVRRECFEKMGYFDETRGIFGEDWMMWVQIAARYPVYFIDEVLVTRRVWNDSFEHRAPEAQFENLFRNLERIRSLVPELAARPELFREAAFRICVARGTDDLHFLKVPTARNKLRRALGYKPTNLRAWTLLLGSYTPLFILRGLKAASKTLRNR